MRSGVRTVIVASLVVAAVPVLAAPPALPGASVEARSGVTISSAVAGASSGWVGWSAPAVDGHRLCCNWDRGQCDLADSGFSVEDRPGAGDLQVFVEVRQGRVHRVRALSASCGVRAKGQKLVWLDDVPVAQSVAWLSDVAAGTGSELPDEAMGALAFHDDRAVDAALGRLASPGLRHEIRKKAAFWLGIARGRAGYERLLKLTSDADADFREELAFAISRSAEPGALDALIALARRDPDTGVRRKALFWLGQQAGERARAALGEAVEDDPETEVKEAAVFALSQLPDDEAIPALIRVAETHRNPEVRRKAMFWLGESGDPRALAYFEKVLSR